LMKVDYFHFIELVEILASFTIFYNLIQQFYKFLKIHLYTTIACTA
jgi:hypothetical protein